MLRRLFCLWFLLATPAQAGLFGSDAPGRIPVPARVFEASVEDTAGTSVALTRVTFNGEVYLYGLLGKGQVTVHFEDITRVSFEPGPDADHRLATVQPREGDAVQLLVESDLPVYGKTSFGNYRIDVSDLRILTFPE